MPAIGLGKSPVITVFSASLASAGAFTATTSSVASDFGYITVLCQYLTGSGAGAFKFYAQVSPDNGTTWFDKTVSDVPLSGSTGFLESNLDTLVSKIPAQGNCSKSFTFSTFGGNAARLQVAEYGVTGSAGFLIVKTVGRVED